MRIELDLTPREFYLMYVKHINEVVKMNLTGTEESVLSEIMLAYYHTRSLPKEQREMVAMSTASRKKMIENLGTKEASFNNNLSALRSKEGMWGQALLGNEVNPNYMYIPKNDKPSINYEIQLKNE